MKAESLEKFSSKVSPEILESLRQVAALEGREIQAVVEDALREYLVRRQIFGPRDHVMPAFASSLKDFDMLYQELANELQNSSINSSINSEKQSQIL